METHVLDGSSEKSEITALLCRWNDGDVHALNDLFPGVYQELHHLASRLMVGERKNHTLQATALVHEAFVTLSSQKEGRWQNRIHFFAVAARIMRHILVDHAKKLGRQRHGGGLRKLPLAGLELAQGERATGLLELEEALRALALFDSRKAWILELRFFGGLSVQEIADLLDLSVSSVVMFTRLARAWLFDYLYPSTSHA